MEYKLSDFGVTEEEVKNEQPSAELSLSDFGVTEEEVNNTYNDIEDDELQKKLNDVDTKATQAKQRLLKLIEEHPEQKDAYMYSYNNIDSSLDEQKTKVLKNHKEQLKLKKEIKEFEPSMTAAERTFGTEEDWGAVGSMARGAGRVGLGVLRVASGIVDSIGNIASEEDRINLKGEVENWIIDNEKEIVQNMDKYGYAVNPASVGQFIMDFAPLRIASSIHKLNVEKKVKAGELTRLQGSRSKLSDTKQSLIDSANVGLSMYGSGEVDEKGVMKPISGGESLLWATGTYLGSNAINTILKKFEGKESLLYDRLVRNSGLANDTNVSEEELLQNYADMIGKDILDLNASEKITAIALGYDNANMFLKGSLANEAQEISDFSKYAKKIKASLSAETGKGGIKEISTSFRQTDDEFKNYWNSFRDALDAQYGDEIVDFTKLSSEYKQIMRKVYTDIKNDMPTIKGKREYAYLLQDLSNGQVTISQMMDAKQQLGKYIFGDGGVMVKDISPQVKKAYKDLYDNIDNELKQFMPEGMKDEYENLLETSRKIYESNNKKLMKHFSELGDDAQAKDIENILDAMRGFGDSSSYSQFFKAIGSDSKNADAIETGVLNYVLNNKSGNGFVSFDALSTAIQDLNFKSDRGKALKQLFNQYGDVFKNLEDVGGKIRKEGTPQSLTLDPIRTLAYNMKSGAYEAVTSILGLTKVAEQNYIVRNLAKSLNLKQMPKNFNLKQQTKAVKFHNNMTTLKKLGNMSAEDVELGAGNIYPSSNMIGEIGAKRLTNKDVSPNISSQLDLTKQEVYGVNKDDIDTEKIWEKTGWHYDKVDDRYKFHLSNDDTRIKFTKGKLYQSGEYKLEDILDAEQLYSAYPELRNTDVILFNDEPSLRGYFSPQQGIIGININKEGFELSSRGGTATKQIKATLAHEIQHLIQGEEGFFGGGNPTSAGGFKEYLSLHGEVEARALTKGDVGTAPQKIYDKEYATGDSGMPLYDPKEVANKRAENKKRFEEAKRKYQGKGN